MITEEEIKNIVKRGDAKFVKIDRGLVFFFDSLTNSELYINTESISVNAVRHKVITHRMQFGGLKFKIQVYLTDAIMFLFRAHNIPRRIAMEAAAAASEIINNYLHPKSDSEENKNAGSPRH